MDFVGSGSVSFDTDTDSGSSQFFIRIRIQGIIWIPRIRIRNTILSGHVPPKPSQRTSLSTDKPQQKWSMFPSTV